MNTASLGGCLARPSQASKQTKQTRMSNMADHAWNPTYSGGKIRTREPSWLKIPLCFRNAYLMENGQADGRVHSILLTSGT